MKMMENLKTLTIYVTSKFQTVSNANKTETNNVTKYLDMNEIIKTYQVKIFDKHCLFSRKILY